MARMSPASALPIEGEVFMEERVARLEAKVEKSFAAFGLQMEKSFGALRTGRMLDRIWWLVIAGAILSVMARGCKWI